MESGLKSSTGTFILYPTLGKETYRHKSLSHTGQHGRPQRVHQDLVLRDGKHQQGDGVLWTQVL